MNRFKSMEQLLHFLAETRICATGEWDPERPIDNERYEFPDYDYDIEEFSLNGAIWQNPVPLSPNEHLFPEELGLFAKDNILFFDNIHVQKKKAPVAVFDAFDTEGVPCTFAMFGQGDTALRDATERIVLVRWSFEGLDDDNELAWEHSVCV